MSQDGPGDDSDAIPLIHALPGFHLLEQRREPLWMQNGAMVDSPVVRFAEGFKIAHAILEVVDDEFEVFAVLSHPDKGLWLTNRLSQWQVEQIPWIGHRLVRDQGIDF